MNLTILGIIVTIISIIATIAVPLYFSKKKQNTTNKNHHNYSNYYKIDNSINNSYNQTVHNTINYNNHYSQNKSEYEELNPVLYMFIVFVFLGIISYIYLKYNANILLFLLILSSAGVSYSIFFLIFSRKIIDMPLLYKILCITIWIPIFIIIISSYFPLFNDINITSTLTNYELKEYMDYFTKNFTSENIKYLIHKLLGTLILTFLIIFNYKFLYTISRQAFNNNIYLIELKKDIVLGVLIYSSLIVFSFCLINGLLLQLI